jgi:predicted dehydrogenase
MSAGSRPVRWGILGTAQIARKNWKAIANTGNAVVAAVASREKDRSRRFIADCQAEARFEAEPAALGSYEELVASPDVDALYIPLPTGVRKEWVVRAAEAGKHVLCEKPCARTAADLKEMLDACRFNSVQFMDGVMFMHSRRLARMREVLHDGITVGPVKRVTSSFGACIPEDALSANIRGQRNLEPLGCLGDLGWYCIRLSLWAMDWRLPSRVTARDLSGSGGAGCPGAAPTSFSAELGFDGGESAAFFCSFASADEQWATISGTSGYLYIPDFVLPFVGHDIAFEAHKSVYTMRGCDITIDPRHVRFLVAEQSNSHPSSQETNLFRTFSDLVQSGRIDAFWPDVALKTQRVVDACVEAARTGAAVRIAG